MMQFVILPLLVATTQAAIHAVSEHHDAVQHHKVSPHVQVSDAEHQKDYPVDARPVADKYYVFNHPYPAVQDSSDFDRDFVKDENSDGGQWQAHMEYDTLRTKIRKAKDKLKGLKEKMENEYEDWMRAKGKAGDAHKKAVVAGDEVGKAQQAAKKAADRVNELEGKAQTDGTRVGGAIGDAVKEVEKEMKDLEDCKKQLEAAKQKLKKLLKDKEEFEKKAKAAKEEQVKQEKKVEKVAKKQAEEDKVKAEAAKKKHAEAKAAAKDAKDAEEEAGYDEEAWQKKLEKEKADHAKALKSYEEELKDVKITEDQLARAAENLRKYRRPPYVDGNGGVYHDGKSNAFSASIPLGLLFVVLTANLFA